MSLGYGPDGNQMAGRLEKISRGIGLFLARRLRDRSGFGARSFYGEAYSLLLLFQTGLLEQDLKEILLSEYGKKDKSNPEFHWEFNNYALMEYLQASGDESFSSFLKPLRFRNISVTNWTLLRDAVKIMEGSEKKSGIEEAKKVLKERQIESGFILDEPRVRSFQYHCFSSALLAQISLGTGEAFFEDRFLRALAFIRNFILSNGDVTYVGRGQQQSFGYGALLYALAQGYGVTGDESLLSDMDVILGRLEKFQKKDGSFPLVLNSNELEIPECSDPSDERFPGWYPYNNYFDYLPFFGSYVWKTKELIEKFQMKEFSEIVPRSYSDDSFQKVAMKKYEAVISKCGGYWTNDLPMPYLVFKGQTWTPCYGGEQFQKSIYDLSGIPIPQWGPGFFSFRRFSIHRFSRNKMTFFSPGGFVRRDFKFGESGFRVETKIYSPFKVRHLYLFPESIQLTEDTRVLQRLGLTITSDCPLTRLGTRYSASGRLNLYGVISKKSVLTYELEP